MTLEVAKVITHVREIHGDTYSAPEIGSALALICGAISIGIGLLRIGFILEFIPGKLFRIRTIQGLEHL
jgi:sodium-independent sulfate anion transporter 11